MSHPNPESVRSAIGAALKSARANLAASPRTLMTVAMAAGMAASAAQAWAGDFEYAGRRIGDIVGSQAGNGYGPASQLGGLIGGMVLSGVGRTIDDRNRAATEMTEAEARARRDAAYDKARREADPYGASQGATSRPETGMAATIQFINSVGARPQSSVAPQAVPQAAPQTAPIAPVMEAAAAPAAPAAKRIWPSPFPTYAELLARANDAPADAAAERSSLTPRPR